MDGGTWNYSLSCKTEQLRAAALPTVFVSFCVVVVVFRWKGWRFWWSCTCFRLYSILIFLLTFFSPVKFWGGPGVQSQSRWPNHCSVEKTFFSLFVEQFVPMLRFTSLAFFLNFHPRWLICYQYSQWSTQTIGVNESQYANRSRQSRLRVNFIEKSRDNTIPT